MADDDTVEQTLYACRDGVKVFSIPAVKGADGRVLSGEWRVDDCMFTGRLRLLAKGDHAEIRLEEPNSGDLFAVAPIPPGSRAQVVEPVSDSSRNFVLRVADAATGRHAFVGLGFAERPEAFDFNVALGDHDKHVRRGREIEEAKNAAVASAAAPSSSASSSASTSSRQQQQQQQDGGDSVRSAVSALYGAAGRDLSLKEGQTIKVAVVKSGGGGAAAGDAAAAGAAPGGGGFLSRQQTATTGGLFGLPPPPGTGLAPPPPPAADSAPAVAPAADDQGWATFD